MTKLQVKPTQYFVLNYHEFDQFIKSVYGKPFEAAADLESPNDTAFTFDDMKKAPFTSKWDINKLEKFKTTGQGCFLTRLLLQDLINNDFAPEGNYLINVSW